MRKVEAKAKFEAKMKRRIFIPVHSVFYVASTLTSAFMRVCHAV